MFRSPRPWRRRAPHRRSRRQARQLRSSPPARSRSPNRRKRTNCHWFDWSSPQSAGRFSGMRRGHAAERAFAAAVEPLERRRLLSYTRFAVIGDYSEIPPAELPPGATQPLADVANLINGWRPHFIATAGDNNYFFGEAATIDQNIGKYFHDYIAPYTGSYGAGSVAGNRFWPSLGNHDYLTPNAQPYLDYFTLPGNERYY